MWALLFFLLYTAFAVHSIDPPSFTVDANDDGETYIRRGFQTNITITFTHTAPAQDSESHLLTNLYNVYTKIGEDGTYVPATRNHENEREFSASLYFHEQESTLYILVETNDYAEYYDSSQSGNVRPSVEVSYSIFAQIALTESSDASGVANSLYDISDGIVAYSEDGNNYPETNTVTFSSASTAGSNVQISVLNMATDSGKVLFSTAHSTDEYVYGLTYDGGNDMIEDSIYEIQPHDYIPNDGFGSCIAMSNGLAVIGAKDRHNGLHAGAGAVYVYRYIGDKWVEQQTLVQNFPHTNENFGLRCDISGNIIVVSGNADKTYIYESVGTVSLYTLSKVVSHYGTGTTTGESHISTDGKIVAVIPEKGLTSGTYTHMEIFEKISGKGWTMKQKFEVSASGTIKGLECRKGVCAVWTYDGGDEINLYSYNSISGEWESFFTLTPNSAFDGMAFDGSVICVSDSGDIECIYSTHNAPAYGLITSASVSTGGGEFTFGGRLYGSKQASSDNDFVPVRNSGAFAISLDMENAVSCSFADASGQYEFSSCVMGFGDYSTNMRDNPIKVAPTATPTLVASLADYQAILFFNHSTPTEVDSDYFRFESPTCLTYDSATDSYSSPPCDQIIGEPMKFRIYTEFTNTLSPNVFGFYQEGNDITDDFVRGDDGSDYWYDVDLPAAKFPSSGTMNICSANYFTYALDNNDPSTPHCFTNVAGDSIYTVYGEMYPYIFPTASTNNDGVTTVMMGFVNEYYVPVSRGSMTLSSTSPDVSNIVCNVADNNICTFKVYAPIGTNKKPLTFTVTNVFGTTETATFDITLTVSRHEFVPTLPTGVDTVARIRLFDEDGNEIRDGRSVSVIWNGLDLGEATWYGD
eukprot:gnl/Chilomastix_cuspidata/659.p1 GENE.gnl/Chilomastix_cuspidata/659~~gnl/Chilomastix_cuspidata/659.p1  ORF type:complete len:866 (+),score=31.91 gnl/Chilomastix_cuspidata/659:31-2628(+)